MIDDYDGLDCLSISRATFIFMIQPRAVNTFVEPEFARMHGPFFAIADLLW